MTPNVAPLSFASALIGVVQHEMSFLFDRRMTEDKRLLHLRPCTRREAYRADITYGTNNEFGFDYLRDNMVSDLDQCVQRELRYAIVDEVDSILIDEARTPLIISGPTEDSTDLYYRIDRIIPSLKREEHYTIEEKTKTAALTEEGNEKVERALGVSNLYDPANLSMVHHVVQGLRAHVMYHRDVDYVVKTAKSLLWTSSPPDARTPLVRRTPSGSGSERGGQDRQRKPNAGVDNLPKPLPDV